MAFIWVLLAVSVVAITVMRLSYSDMIRGDRLAYEKTLAQIHSIMNLAYAYRVRNGDWPMDKRDCLIPSDYIAGMSEAVNGWGYTIEGVPNCQSHGGRYLIQQVVPRGFLDRISSVLDETVRGEDINPGSDTIRMVVELDETMVDEKKLYFATMESVFDDVAAVQCPVGLNAHYVVGVDAACGNAQLDAERLIETEETNVDKNPTYMGFATVYQYLDSENVTTLTFKMSVKNSVNFERNLSDHFQFSSKYCPNLDDRHIRRDINVMIMSWCEPQEL